MFWYDNDMSWWGWAGMGVGMVLFWALVIAGIVALIAYSTAIAAIANHRRHHLRQNRCWPLGSHRVRSAKPNTATG
jgi:hypothetical protein